MEHEYKLYYLASPYTHKDYDVLQERYEKVNALTTLLLLQKVYVFSPITYNHPMGRDVLPIEWSFWKPYDTAFLERCDVLLVLKLDGWKESVGVTAEIEIAKRIGIPIMYLEPKEVAAEDYKFVDLTTE